MVSPLYTPPPFDDEEDNKVESSSKEVNYEHVKCVDYVNKVPLITQQDPSLALTKTSVPIID